MAGPIVRPPVLTKSSMLIHIRYESVQFSTTPAITIPVFSCKRRNLTRCVDLGATLNARLSCFDRGFDCSPPLASPLRALFHHRSLSAYVFMAFLLNVFIRSSYAGAIVFLQSVSRSRDHTFRLPSLTDCRLCWSMSLSFQQESPS